MSKRSLILLVEDNEANQLLASAVHECAGYRVELAGTAAEVLDQLKVQVPDLILMDVQLPGEDGLSVTRRLKADPATARIPVVALTAFRHARGQGANPRRRLRWLYLQADRHQDIC